MKSINDSPPELLSLSNEFANLKLMLSSLSPTQYAVKAGNNALEGRDMDEVKAILVSDAAAWVDTMALVEHLERSYRNVGFTVRRRKWIRDRRGVRAAVDYVQVKIMSIKGVCPAIG